MTTDVQKLAISIEEFTTVFAKHLEVNERMCALQQASNETERRKLDRMYEILVEGKNGSPSVLTILDRHAISLGEINKLKWLVIGQLIALVGTLGYLGITHLMEGG